MSLAKERQTDPLHSPSDQAAVSMNPYRTAVDHHPSTPRGSNKDCEAIITYVLMLIVSLPSMMTAIVRHETFDGEASLAALIVVLCLCLLGLTLISTLSRRKRRGARESAPSVAAPNEEHEL